MAEKVKAAEAALAIKHQQALDAIIKTHQAETSKMASAHDEEKAEMAASQKAALEQMQSVSSKGQDELPKPNLVEQTAATNAVVIRLTNLLRDTQAVVKMQEQTVDRLQQEQHDHQEQQEQ